jgi:outer membrane protein assembly factor BamD (BamD/ComL family)
MKHAGKHFCGVWLVSLLTGTGCVSFQSERDAVARYEQTREEMNRVARGEWQKPSYEEESLIKQREAKQPLKAGDFAPKNLGATFKRLIGRGPSQPEAERLYQAGQTEYAQALQILEQRSLEEARPLMLAAADYFAEAAERWPESTLEQNALFYAGEAYFFADHYPKSNDNFELLLKHHPNSRYLDQVQQRRFAIAQYWLEEYNKSRPGWYVVNVSDKSQPRNDLFGRSMKVFDRIRLDDPTGKLADDATLALANAYFAEGKYFKADDYYTDLRKTFPSSEHQFTAHFVGLKAKLMVYEGPDYGGTVLNDAEKLIETIRRQFPVEAENEREFLNRAYAETRYKKAEREYVTGQYFDQKAEYGAAKQYFQVVLKDYGDTPFADNARTRMAELGGLPDVPPQRFEWLVDVFPDEGSVRPLIATDKPKTKKR